MKTLLSLLGALTLVTGAAAQQSLGDVARQSRAQQKPAAIARFDDDSMRRSADSNTPATADDTKKEGDQAAKTADGKDQPAKDAEPAAKPKAEDWTKKIEDQKKEISTLQRELDIQQREQRLRAAAFYGDAGTQLRDQGKFSQDSRQEQEQIDQKKLALDAAQQKLADLQEQARKAGVSSE